MTPEALRLADALETYGPKPWANNAHQAAKELRRLHALNQELLDAFDEILAIKFSNWSDEEMREIARAAVAKVKEQT